MNKFIFRLSVLSCVILASCTPLKKAPTLEKSPLTVSSGNLYRTTVFHPEFGDSLLVDIWTPEDYTSDYQFPVIYMHDGQNLFDSNSTWNKQSWQIDEVCTDLIDKKMIQPVIVVGVHSIAKSRTGDLMPKKVVDLIQNEEDAALWKQWSPYGNRSDAYLKCIVETIKPMVDSIFSTNPSAKATSIMGSSMGGLISLYGLCEYPNVFGSAACLSTHLSSSVEHSSHADALFEYLYEKLPRDNAHRIYLDCGDQTIDANYIPYYFQLIKVLDNLGYANKMMHGFYPGAAHDENSWAARVAAPIQYLEADYVETPNFKKIPKP